MVLVSFSHSANWPSGGTTMHTYKIANLAQLIDLISASGPDARSSGPKVIEATIWDGRSRRATSAEARSGEIPTRRPRETSSGTTICSDPSSSACSRTEPPSTPSRVRMTWSAPSGGASQPGREPSPTLQRLCDPFREHSANSVRGHAKEHHDWCFFVFTIVLQ